MKKSIYVLILAGAVWLAGCGLSTPWRFQSSPVNFNRGWGERQNFGSNGERIYFTSTNENGERIPYTGGSAIRSWKKNL